MNSIQAFNIINYIGSDNSSKFKEAVLKAHINDDMFRNILEHAYNPRKIYGVVPQLDWITTSGESVFDESTFFLLESLINRDITGHNARDAILTELQRLDKESGILLINVIKKDLRAGFSDTLINKTYPGLIPEYAYMRCSLLKKVKESSFNFSAGVFSQVKLDGLFANGNILDDFQFTSRSGSTFPMDEFKNIADSVKQYNGLQTHGELLVKQDDKILPRKIGNGILNSVMSGGKFEENQKPVYIVWDVIPIEEARTKNKYHKPYYERLKQLEDMFVNNEHIQVVDYKICYSLRECIQHSIELIKLGFEGTVFKDRDMIWQDGTSKGQVKVKVEFDCDLKIIGIKEGKVQTKNEGRPGVLECESADGLLKVNVTIKNEKMRDLIEKDQNVWIGRIVTVTANEIIDSDGKDTYSLFLPRLAEDTYRNDKIVADDFERIKDSYNSVVNGSMT